METGLIISSILLWVVVLLNLLLTLALVRRLNRASHPEQGIGLKAGELAPDFTAHTLSGETITRSAYAGRNVAFIFISTHCVPCHEILPRLEPLGPKASRVGTELVLVSGDEIEDTRTFAEELNISLPILIAPRKTNSFITDYQSTGTPSYCLIDGQGRVQSAGYPSLEWGAWKTLVDAWNQQDVPVA